MIPRRANLGWKKAESGLKSSVSLSESTLKKISFELSLPPLRISAAIPRDSNPGQDVDLQDEFHEMKSRLSDLHALNSPETKPSSIYVVLAVILLNYVFLRCVF